MLHYVRQTQKTTLEHITSLSYSEAADYLMLDAATIRNLELFESSSGDTKDTLLGVINRTRTGMGARLLRNWVVRPSIDRIEIESRLDAVAELSGSAVALEDTRTSFDGIFDLERLLSKITVGTASPRELTSLRASIAFSPMACSGDIYCGVPSERPVCVIRCPPADCTASAMPKSATSAWPPCSRMFSGLMSR